MRVPAHLQEIKERLALQSWVDGKQFPRDAHFESIDAFKGRLGKHQQEEDASLLNAKLATMVAGALDVEGYLLTYVIEQGTYPIDDEETWGNICLAAGWVVLQRYERECTNEKWTPHE